MSQEGWAQRFELYWRGVEIANAYNELRDVDEQKKRFEIENQKLEAIGRQQHPQDNTFFKALERGLPPCGGIAVGLERLFMAAQGISRIKELSYFD